MPSPGGDALVVATASRRWSRRMRRALQETARNTVREPPETLGECAASAPHYAAAFSTDKKPKKKEARKKRDSTP